MPLSDGKLSFIIVRKQFETLKKNISVFTREGGRKEEPIELFLVPTVLHDWCNKGRGICYPVCEMMHIKEPLLLIGKRKEMSYLTTHSTHFIYGYMASDIC